MGTAGAAGTALSARWQWPCRAVAARYANGSIIIYSSGLHYGGVICLWILRTYFQYGISLVTAIHTVANAFHVRLGSARE